MTHAYDQTYLEDAQANLGEMADYAANCCRCNMPLFWSAFVSTGYAAQFEAGSPKVISGLSGTELACHILYDAGLMHENFPAPSTDYTKSAAYWGGWIVAYFQWHSGYAFQTILHHIPWPTLIKLYPTLHEAPPEKFLEVGYAMLRKTWGASPLQYQRKLCGLSQSELAERAGVNLRTLQQYETGAKDLNKAAVDTVRRLAKALHCRIETLLPPQDA
jgi:DNA-binding XRE family transcriptional regulator